MNTRVAVYKYEASYVHERSDGLLEYILSTNFTRLWRETRKLFKDLPQITQRSQRYLIYNKERCSTGRRERFISMLLNKYQCSFLSFSLWTLCSLWFLTFSTILFANIANSAEPKVRLIEEDVPDKI